MTYQASQLSLPGSGLTVQLRFVPPSYELSLRNDTKKSSTKALFSGGDLRSVTLDMLPVTSGGIRLSYVSRHILIEIDTKLFARVMDVDFMRLHNAASLGAGECITAGDAFDLR